MNRGVRTPVRGWGAALLGGALGAVVLQSARAGHESPFYPSFYPQEIRIETLDPGAARAGWNKARVHVYVGADPFSGGAPPADATALLRLHGLLVLTFDGSPGRQGPANGGKQDHCASAGRVLGALAPGVGDFVAHPYPVTPYHADYLQHFDLAQEARARLAGAAADGAANAPLRIRARGEVAQSLIPARWKAPASGWDATLEEIDLERLAAADGSTFGGWSGLPWAKQGWYQAYRLLGDQPQEGAARKPADRTGERLLNGEYRDPVERINLERALVSTLVAGCGRMVVGYRVTRERFNSEYSVGVENIAFDSQSGFDSPVFPRTVKLKDFIWNGWLRLGIASKPAAAWNPVGGLNDGFGRMLWGAVGDPALLPAPHGGHWIANRVIVGQKPVTAAVAIPRDAVRPQPGTGIPQPVGTGRTAQRQLRYFVTLSEFHHGISTGVADILYPYIFAFRWGAGGPGADAVQDPAVARATALVSQWLAGFKVIRVEKQVRNYGADLKFSYQVAVVDVYLNHRLGDPWQRSRPERAARSLNTDPRSSEPWEEGSIAPPWSTLPWEVMVLMEEAVRRGIAAFTEAEAKRRGIPWLDLARDRETGKRLAALVESFRLEAYRPGALKELVSADEARERWTALAGFHAKHGHFLVTNGPYRLESWSADAAVLQVFRDLSYPVGLGTFDDLAIPLKAYVSKVENRGARLELRADVERVSKFARSYDIVRTALEPASRDADERERLECRYVIVGPGGKVVRAGAETLNKNGRFVVDFGKLTVPGRYQVMTSLVLGGNSVNPEIKVFEHRVGGG
ncbi:MAG TPA: hypothetical protein VLA81_09575 [Burkholderiales bacterium]|nr:hypothetical protein [Burkholderiales bacterium]